MLILFSGSTHGASPSGDWYELLSYSNLSVHLNEMEKTTLDRRRIAMTGDPDALLDLAILASGFPRDPQSYHAFHQIVWEFIQRLQAKLDAARSAKDKGRILFMAMRESFLSKDTQLAGYDKQQSRLTTLLSTHRYNCFSASILYLILARQIGLDVAGVMLPSHTFVELHTPDGEIVEIEPTAHDGFGLRHDANYYANEASKWSLARGFAPSTYQDYLKRTIHSPYDFISQNLIAQHSADAATPREEQTRLLEIWSLLNPFRKAAHQARLSLYQQKYEQLEKKKDTTSIVSFYQKIGPYLQQVVSILPNEGDLREQVAWAALQFALTLSQLDRYEEASPWIDFALTNSLLQNSRAESLRENALLLKQTYTRKLVDKGRFQEAIRQYDTYRTFCKNNENCSDPTPWIHQKWAEQLLMENRLDEAITHLILRFDLLPENNWEERDRSQKRVSLLYVRRIRQAMDKESLGKAWDLFAEQRAWSRGNLEKSKWMSDNPGKADQGVFAFLSDWTSDEEP